ncbi:hypothetical protein INT48_003490 [Thamnidium elegans]|uniref:Uncharacterized protein n=1 Tax=Thamnidium elegans TaxID=101142 RepID=A0A8H7SHM8_9FUNG|nr:hypothetical protein INT48_003490 [Thamnidium elegans]
MTSSITRSSRSSVKKVTAPTIDNVIKPKSSTQIKKKKQIQRIRKDADLENRSYQQQQQQEQHQQYVYFKLLLLLFLAYIVYIISRQSQNNESLSSSKIDASEHPEYIRLMSQLDQSKNERLQKVENWRKFERQSIHDWFAAQKKQAWDDFYFAKRKVRSDLVQDVQRKIQKLEQELSLLNKQRGASNDEIDRDLVYARQPYNGNNTPNLVYSDYESRSTTDTAEDVEVVSPSRTEIASSSSPTSTINDNYTTNQYQPPIFEQPNNQQVEQPSSSTNIYPPFEFDEMPQDGRRDWWPYRSTTTA